MAKVIRSNLLTTPKMAVRTAYENFLRVKSSLCAKSTVDIYREIGERHIIPELTELTGDDIYSVTADILNALIDNYRMTHDNGGVLFYYRHLKAFVNWFWDYYDVESSCPMRKVKVRKVETPPKQGITHEEIDKLLKACKAHSVFPERDTAMIMLLCDTGIRRSSLANLKMQDVNMAQSQITVFEKDQQFHIKPYGIATGKAIKKYLSCLADVKPDDPFWLCMDGTALSWEGMREVLRRLCASAKIPMHHFHDFRRFYGLELYNSTHDIYMVSRALDHKDIEVTKRYLAIDKLEDAEATRSHSPMDRRLQQTGVRIKRNAP